MIPLSNKQNVDNSDPNFPNGKSQDTTTYGPGNGTPIDFNRFNDWDQLMEQVMGASNITPDGNPDNENNGYQLYKAFRKLFRPYRVYTVLISQSGTNDPTVDFLGLNDIGNIVWTRINSGAYIGELTGAFTEDETFYQISTGVSGGLERFFRRVNDNQMLIDTTLGGTPGDNALNKTPLEIRIYDLSL